jgi:hypothetical protein
MERDRARRAVRRSPNDGLFRIAREAVGFQGRPDCEGAAGRGVKQVRQLNPSNTNPVDRGVLERSLQFQHGRWWIGRPEG